MKVEVGVPWRWCLGKGDLTGKEEDNELPAAFYNLARLAQQQQRDGITRLRGIWGACRIGELEIPVMPTFHPAFVLRQYTTEVRAAVWEDLQAAHARAFDS